MRYSQMKLQCVAIDNMCLVLTQTKTSPSFISENETEKINSQCIHFFAQYFSISFCIPGLLSGFHLLFDYLSLTSLIFTEMHFLSKQWIEQNGMHFPLHVFSQRNHQQPQQKSTKFVAQSRDSVPTKETQTLKRKLKKHSLLQTQEKCAILGLKTC